MVIPLISVAALVRRAPARLRACLRLRARACERALRHARALCQVRCKQHLEGWLDQALVEMHKVPPGAGVFVRYGQRSHTHTRAPNGESRSAAARATLPSATAVVACCMLHYACCRSSSSR